MNLAHVCHVFPSFATGGPEVRTAALIDASAEHFRHTVVSLHGNLSGQGRIHRAQDVAFVDASQPRGQLAGALALRRLLIRLKPDLVLTYGWGGTDAAAVARFAGFRRVIHAEDGFLPDESSAQKFRRLLIRRMVFRLPACVVVPSQTLARIAAQTWWLPAQRVRFLPNGIDTARFAPATPESAHATRLRLGYNPEEVVIGAVGHLRQEKNHFRLLAAFADLAAKRPAQLLLLGEGPLREALMDQARKLGLADRVQFTGVVSDPSAYYPAMDILAMSSDTEQMPLAVLEAMGAGLPVLSTDVGDVKGMVCDANRRFVTALGDEECYSQALGELADGPVVRAQLGQANRERCLREFSFDKMVRSYLDLYREVLAV